MQMKTARPTRAATSSTVSIIMLLHCFGAHAVLLPAATDSLRSEKRVLTTRRELALLAGAAVLPMRASAYQEIPTVKANFDDNEKKRKEREAAAAKARGKPNP